MALIIVGILIGFAFASASQTWRQLPPGLTFADRVKAFLRESWTRASPASAEPPPPPLTLPVPESLEVPLAVKLRKLETAFLPVAENAAHPREFLDEPSFQEAAGLLRSDTVPLKTVLQYVLGTNWGLSCAGLAALAERPDRADARQQVLSGFDRLTPWAWHYALAYFLTLNPRPAPGAPFVSAKEWWRDNPAAAMAAQEYFDESELFGDAPTFGGALDAVPPSSYPLIRGFLERLHHSCASALIREIDTRQR